MANSRQNMRRETRRQQREALGKSVHPRGLARSVAKFINTQRGVKPSAINGFKEMVAELPKTGKSRLKPEVARNCRKIDT